MSIGAVRRSTDRGAITAELAVALPAVGIMILVVLLMTTVSITHLRVSDAARAGARSAALGEPDDTIRQIIMAVAGDSAEMQITREPPWVTVSVTRSVGADWLNVSPLRAHGEASARLEP